MMEVLKTALQWLFHREKDTEKLNVNALGSTIVIITIHKD